MGKYDICMQEYLQNKEYFADLFNGCFFHGQQVIRPEELTEASEGYVVDDATRQKTRMDEIRQSDTGKVTCHLCDASGMEVYVEKSEHRLVNTRNRKSKMVRDVKMRLHCGTVLQVLAVENQSYVDYGMPVRCMGYDFAEYNRQVKERRQCVNALWKQMEEQGKGSLAVPVTYAEYMSGIRKKDLLHPVYTICLYSGMEEWDGPRRLSDMMEFPGGNDSLKNCFADYPVNLFCVNEQEQFENFRTELRELFLAMNCRKDKKKFMNLMKDEQYAHLSGETLEAITIMTDYKILAANREAYRNVDENGREEYDMCEALRELREDFLNEGRLEEQEKGIKRLILDNLEEKKPKDVIVEKLVRWFSLEQEEAGKYYERYAHDEGNM